MEKEELLADSAEAASLFCRLYMNTKREIPVRSSHMGLLILIVKNKTPVTPLVAANFFRVKKPMITAMVNSLEKGGYLVRERSDTDRRSYRILPTQKTVRLVEETYGEYYKVTDALYNGLGQKDFMILLGLLTRANDILTKEKDGSIGTFARK